jgi:hypothetical protein
VPEGVDAAEVDRTAAALAAKRLRAVRRAWPALARDVGAQLEPRFADYARSVPVPDGGAAADGLAFAAVLGCEGHRLGGEARVEVALARARGRRSLAAVLVRRPRRLVLVVGMRRGAVRTLTLGLGGRRGGTGWPAS